MPTVGFVEELLHRLRKAGSDFADRHGPWSRGCYEFLVFGIKQAWACLFGGLFLAILLLTHFFYPQDAWIARYDFLVIAAVTIQTLLLVTRMETMQEAKIILVYHLVGTAMELFKTKMGSWQYTEDSVLRLGTVPLFSGFMYAAVGSYLARVWRLFDFRFSRYPNRSLTIVLAMAIYINFFTHHYSPDVRWPLTAMVLALYGRTWIYFRIDREARRMPLVLGFFLVSVFIWLAENLATFARAWTYPDQQERWQMVGANKLGAWFLLMNISFVLVTLVSRPRVLGST